jgi:hypothetical protein
MDAFTGTSGAPKGESKINAQDRVRTTEPRKSRATEFKPNAAATINETPANRIDRLRETDVCGLTLKHYIERKSDRY